MPSAIVIGHTGQDGRILWDQLADRGYRLAGISGKWLRVDGQDRERPAYASDDDPLGPLIGGFGADEIYYLAACHHGSERAMPDIADLARTSWTVHVEQFEQTLRQIRQSSPRTRVFYASSSRIFGAGDGKPLHERSRTRPECIYGLTKATGMQIARHYRDVAGMHVSCGILFNHESGLRSPQYLSQRVVNGLLDIRDGRSDSFSVGSLQAQADWGYAPDYTRAMQLMVAREEPGDAVVATGVLHSVKDFISLAAEELCVNWVGRVTEQSSLLARPAQGLRGDATLLRRTTGWVPSVDFETMVSRLAREASERRVAGQA
ncbi:MAG TPA: GDP-mannose 4,6-dehydratase [Thiobacillus sp.]